MGCHCHNCLLTTNLTLGVDEGHTTIENNDTDESMSTLEKCDSSLYYLVVYIVL